MQCWRVLLHAGLILVLLRTKPAFKRGVHAASRMSGTGQAVSLSQRSISGSEWLRTSILVRICALTFRSSLLPVGGICALAKAASDPKMAGSTTAR